MVDHDEAFERAAIKQRLVDHDQQDPTDYAHACAEALDRTVASRMIPYTPDERDGETIRAALSKIRRVRKEMEKAERFLESALVPSMSIFARYVPSGDAERGITGAYWRARVAACVLDVAANDLNALRPRGEVLDDE